MRGSKVCPLAQVGFAEQNGAGVAESSGDEGVVRGNRSLKGE